MASNLFKKLLILIFLVIFILITSTHFLLDTIIKHSIETFGSKTLGAEVLVGGVRVSLLKGNLEINELRILNPKGYQNNYALEVKHILINADITSLFSNPIKLYRVEILSPSFTYELMMQANAPDNITAIKKNVQNKEENKSEKSQRKLTLENFLVKNSKVKVRVPNITESTLNLPDIEIKNIGTKENGVEVEKAVEQVVSTIQYNILKLDFIKSLPKLINSTINKTAETIIDIPETIGNQIGNVSKSLNNIFKGQ